MFQAHNLVPHIFLIILVLLSFQSKPYWLASGYSTEERMEFPEILQNEDVNVLTRRNYIFSTAIIS